MQVIIIGPRIAERLLFCRWAAISKSTLATEANKARNLRQRLPSGLATALHAPSRMLPVRRCTAYLLASLGITAGRKNKLH